MNWPWLFVFCSFLMFRRLLLGHEYSESIISHCTADEPHFPLLITVGQIRSATNAVLAFSIKQWESMREIKQKTSALTLYIFTFFLAIVLAKLFPRTPLTSLWGSSSRHFLFECQEGNYYVLESRFLPMSFFWSCCTLFRFVNDFNRGKEKQTNKERTRKERRVMGASGHDWRITLGQLKPCTREHEVNKMDGHYGKGKGTLQ